MPFAASLLLLVLGGCGPAPVSDAQGLNDPTASPPISAFDQVNKDAETWNRPKQMAVSENSTKYYWRLYSGTSWDPWQSGDVQGYTGLQWIRCISQSVRPRDPVDAKLPKQDSLTRDGATLYSRLFISGQWQPPTTTNVSNMGLPGAPSTILCFEQEGPDCATRGLYQQSALSEDGTTLSFRYTTEGSIGWGSWGDPVWGPQDGVPGLPVSSLGLPDGATAIRSFSQGVNPAGRTKQDVLSSDHTTLYTRFYNCDAHTWDAWTSLATSTMGFPP